MPFTELLSRISILSILCTMHIVGCPGPLDNQPLALAQTPTTTTGSAQNYQAYALVPNQASACVPSAIDVFTTTFYSSILAAHGNDFLFKTQLPGSLAAALFYKVLKEELQLRGTSDIEKNARDSSDYFKSVPIFTFPQYSEKSGHAVGIYLYEGGFLNCFNARSLALQFAESVERAFRELDPNNVESYILARIRGLPRFLDSIGYPKEARTDRLGILLKEEYCLVC